MEKDNCSIAWVSACSSPGMITPTAYQFQIPRKEDLIDPAYLHWLWCWWRVASHGTNLVARVHPCCRRRGFLENGLCAITFSKMSTTANWIVELLPNEWMTQDTVLSNLKARALSPTSCSLPNDSIWGNCFHYLSNRECSCLRIFPGNRWHTQIRIVWGEFNKGSFTKVWAGGRKITLGIQYPESLIRGTKLEKVLGDGGSRT